MPFETVEFNIARDDGWVQVASSPSFLLINPDGNQKWNLGITSGSAPASAAQAATATLTFVALPLVSNTLAIGSFVYNFVTTPAGPFDVQIGITIEITIDNLISAIAASDGEGVVYGVGTTRNTEVRASKTGPATALLTAETPGSSGNSISVTEDGVAINPSSPTLVGGVDDQIGSRMSFANENMSRSFRFEGDGTGADFYVRIRDDNNPDFNQSVRVSVIRNQ